jgi:hypothetical protein
VADLPSVAVIVHVTLLGFCPGGLRVPGKSAPEAGRPLVRRAFGQAGRASPSVASLVHAGQGQRGR